MAGQRLLVTSLDTENSGPLKRAAIAKKDSKAMRNIGILMLLLEDIPEFALDVAYIVINGGVISDPSLFTFTIVLSVLHIFRVIAEFSFEHYSLRHFPIYTTFKPESLQHWGTRMWQEVQKLFFDFVQLPGLMSIPIYLGKSILYGFN